MKVRCSRYAAVLATLTLGFIPILVIALHGVDGLHADETESPKAPKLPPLVIDKSAPLLLEEPSGEPGEDQSFLNINQSCFVCHDNYRTEPMVVMHAKESTGCIDCHGPSLAHRNDEDNITPPDIMFPAEEIEEGCQECHDTHDAAAIDVLARWQERCPQKTDFATIVCTDCHGHHRLERRVVRWDKKTGELLLKDTAGLEQIKRKPEKSAGN